MGHRIHLDEHDRLLQEAELDLANRRALDAERRLRRAAVITELKDAGYRIVKLSEDRDAGVAYYDGNGKAQVSRRYAIEDEL